MSIACNHCCSDNYWDYTIVVIHNHNESNHDTPKLKTHKNPKTPKEEQRIHNFLKNLIDEKSVQIQVETKFLNNVDHPPSTPPLDKIRVKCDKAIPHGYTLKITYNRDLTTYTEYK